MKSILLAGLVVAGVAILAPLPAQAQTTYGPPTPQAFPIHPFQQSIFLSPNAGAAAGTGTGAIFGITSLTFANQGSSAVQVDMFQAVTSGGKCSGTITSLGGSPNIFVVIPASATIQTNFPTPLVIARLSGQSCIGFNAVAGLQNGSSVSVLVSGYQN